MKIVIIGYGHVGKAVHAYFPDAIIYDPYLNLGNKEDMKNADVAFISVPTPESENGSCDISIVESVIKEVEAKLIIIRSTIKVGTTKYLINKYKKNIVFSPEFIGVSKDHIYKNDLDVPYIIIGKEESNDISLIYSLYDKEKVHVVNSKEAELAKYTLNSFLALKVTFANEIYDFCAKNNINYDNVKNLVLLDPRVGKTHLNVDPSKLGFGGPCLTKDIKALEKMMDESNSVHHVITSVIEENNEFTK